MHFITIKYKPYSTIHDKYQVLQILQKYKILGPNISGPDFFPQKRYISGTYGEVVRVLSECLKYQFVGKEIKPLVIDDV